jgi:hypothetical protein
MIGLKTFSVYRPLTLVAAVDFSTDKASSHFDIISVNRGDMIITKYFAVDVNKTSQSRICMYTCVIAW